MIDKSKIQGSLPVHLFLKNIYMIPSESLVSLCLFAYRQVRPWLRVVKGIFVLNRELLVLFPVNCKITAIHYKRRLFVLFKWKSWHRFAGLMWLVLLAVNKLQYRMSPNSSLRISWNITISPFKWRFLRRRTFFHVALFFMSSGAPKDGFLLHTLKTLFRLFRALLDL